eukprot:scaffold38867_cov74-Attheya_sp.AAC.1
MGTCPSWQAVPRVRLGLWLNAESYAERVNSMGKLVLTEGNSLLKDDETEMLVALRMNRDFMCFMCEHYGEHILKMQPFCMTVVTVTK